MSENDFSDSGELVKELGLKEALTIGIGTMIGAGIFVLPRLAIEQAGPAAILSYVLAGVICMITAASTAELATGMPKSGGAYFFISRAMGSLVGTLSGISVWLSLTFAVAFYLQGFGQYLASMIPLNPTILAVLAGIFFTYVNYVGAKETGKIQNIIVGILLTILTVFVGWGAFNFETSILVPFFPQGAGPVLPVMAIIFVSFLGFVQIASVAEEIKNPSYTLPRAIIGSVAIVTLIYALVLLITTGILPYQDIVNIEMPIVEAARVFSGFIGAGVIIFAALLATASSANASILAASRISFALGRDKILPESLNKIHPKFLTPYRPILLTGILTIILVATANVEALSSSASVLMLLNYSLINICVLVMRFAPPKGYEPSYRSPGFPILHIIGAITSLGVIFMAEAFAQIIALVLVLLSFVWFIIWAKDRSKVQGAIKDLNWKDIIRIPAKGKSEEPSLIGDRSDGLFNDSIYKVLIPMANPSNEKGLLKVASVISKGIDRGVELHPLNIVEIPEQTPLDFLKDNEDLLKERHKVQQDMLKLAVDFGEKEGLLIDPHILYSRDKFHTIYDFINKEKVDFLLLGWSEPFSIGKISNSFVKDLIRRANCAVGVLKDNGVEEVNDILIPYRGSEHAYYGIEVAKRIATKNKNSKITILRVINCEMDAKEEEKKVLVDLKDLITDEVEFEIKVVFAGKVVDGIVSETINNQYDLMIIGASKEWRFKNILFGSVPDIVAEKSDTSVLMVRCFDDKVKKINEEIKLEEEGSKEGLPKF